MLISYASSTISSVFDPSVNGGLTGSSTLVHGSLDTHAAVRIYTVAGVAEGAIIMVGYVVFTALVGMWLFEREDFS